MTTLERLLRDGEGLRAQIDAGHDQAETARSLIGLILVAGGLLGAVLGSFRGGIQIPFAAIKLPLVVLFTAAICTPALTVIRSAIGGEHGDSGRLATTVMQRFGRDIVLLLSSLALGVVVAAASAPIMMLAMAVGLPYHELILAVVAACALGGILGLTFLWRALRVDGGAMTAVASLMLVVMLVGGQMAWIGRPYLVRPQSPDPVFMRSSEGSLVDAVQGTVDTLAVPSEAMPAPTERGTPTTRGTTPATTRTVPVKARTAPATTEPAPADVQLYRSGKTASEPKQPPARRLRSWRPIQ